MNFSRKVVLETSRQKLDVSLVSRVESVLSRWTRIKDESDTGTRAECSRLLVETLSIIQAASPIDVVIIAAISQNTSILTPKIGIDLNLVHCFEEFIKRSFTVFSDVLSLTELFRLYCELLDLSLVNDLLSPYRVQFGAALTRRIKANERIPDQFAVPEFLDAFTSDLDEEIMNPVSACVLKRIKSSEVLSLQDKYFVETLLSVDSACARARLKPSSDFVEAVKLFITSAS
jgi:hypothetical protein